MMPLFITLLLMLITTLRLDARFFADAAITILLILHIVYAALI